MSKTEEEFIIDFKGHKPTDNSIGRKSSAKKVSASDVFNNVLTRKEKKTERMQILLTETNKQTLVEYSKKTGRSKNDIINELISTLEKYTNL